MMFKVLRSEDLVKGAIAAVEFEGRDYGAQVSFFRGSLEPGVGPGLHTHPYPETCIVISGTVAMTVDGEEIIGRAGDVIVVGAETPHSFKAAGDGRLEGLCIHASDRFVIDWLE